MITESGTIKVKTRINAGVHRELNRPVRNLGIVYTVAGAVLAVVFAALVVLGVTDGNLDPLDVVLLVCGCIFSVCGVVMIVAYARNIKKADAQDKEVEVEFFNDYILVDEYVDGRLSVSNKIYFGMLVKKRESTHYIFLYSTASTAISIDKEQLTSAELDTVRKLVFRVNTISGAVAFPAPEQRRFSGDPFADFADHGQSNSNADGAQSGSNTVANAENGESDATADAECIEEQQSAEPFAADGESAESSECSDKKDADGGDNI